MFKEHLLSLKQLQALSSAIQQFSTMITGRSPRLCPPFKMAFFQTTPATLPYRADIDGLRGLAVLAVLLFHLNSAWLPGGFIGVDVFFVISGYLITHILLLRPLESSGHLVHFYERRVRRLAFPLLAMGLVTILLVTFGLS